VPYTNIQCDVSELNSKLNAYAGCLISNMELLAAKWIPRRAYRFLPSAWRREQPGPEPMAKNFEAAAAGCAPIMDMIPELRDLGFEDGVTAVGYTGFRELIEKLHWYEANPGALVEIGRRAAELARARHTWDHRMVEFERLIHSRAAA
jgi:spore maturation protein CgeB